MGLFYKLYSDKRQEIQKLKGSYAVWKRMGKKESREIPDFQPDHHLLRILNASSNKRLHYVAVEGLVQATGEPISSQFVPRRHPEDNRARALEILELSSKNLVNASLPIFWLV
ncbi:mitochondrial ubiquitin ligase activator of nfkb 1-A-like [Sinocyclocheilus grahami]|uniref:mitochondrial ubiquitin ligase activator of nfkb 1-A-like n=1 Tax=Sinocyclocheilus grahami TaxID=75366 RepID=UPI0007AD4FAD|nr:PREDICTED: mitochondrial ubiquitin ligase activator of nfkb 1-A-like [Sinocyclocheilus grahami]